MERPAIEGSSAGASHLLLVTAARGGGGLAPKLFASAAEAQEPCVTLARRAPRDARRPGGRQGMRSDATCAHMRIAHMLALTHTHTSSLSHTVWRPAQHGEANRRTGQTPWPPGNSQPASCCLGTRDSRSGPPESKRRIALTARVAGWLKKRKTQCAYDSEGIGWRLRQGPARGCRGCGGGMRTLPLSVASMSHLPFLFPSNS